MVPRKNLKIETVKNAFFNVLVNDSTQYCKKKQALKCTRFLALREKLQENEQLECPILLIPKTIGKLIEKEIVREVALGE